MIGVNETYQGFKWNMNVKYRAYGVIRNAFENGIVYLRIYILTVIFIGFQVSQILRIPEGCTSLIRYTGDCFYWNIENSMTGFIKRYVNVFSESGQ